MIIKLDSNISDLIEKLNPVLLRVYHHGLRMGSLLHKKGIPIEAYMVIHAFERTTESVRSISFLLEQIKTSYYVEHSIGLIIRANILEMMNMIYLRDQFKTISEKEFELLFRRYLASQLMPMQKYLQYMRTQQVISKEQYSSAMEQANNQLAIGMFDFDSRSSEFKFNGLKEWPKPRGIHKEFGKSEYLKRYLYFYDKYFFYSNYEHTGILNAVLKGNEANKLSLMVATTFKEYFGGLMEMTLFLIEILNKKNMSHVISQIELNSVQTELIEIFDSYNKLIQEYDDIVARLEEKENMRLSIEAEASHQQNINELLGKAKND